MATALTLIDSALQEIGVYGAGETVSGDDAALCMDALNDIIDGLKLESLTIYATQDVSASLPAATSSRTIGPAMQFATARPVRLEDGCFITVGNLEYPLEIISQVQYNAIALKTLEGPWPRYVMYDATMPTGTLYFWPQGACTVHLNVQIPLTAFTSTSNTLSVPPGYKRLLELLLAEEVAPKFQKQISPGTAKKLFNARRVVKRSNLVVPQLDVGGCAPLPGCYAILAG